MATDSGDQSNETTGTPTGGGGPAGASDGVGTTGADTVTPGSTTGGSPSTSDGSGTTTGAETSSSGDRTDNSGPASTTAETDDTAGSQNATDWDTTDSDTTVDTSPDDTASSHDTDDTSDSSDTDDTTSGGDTGFAPDDRSAAAVCARWNADRADMREGTWSGSVETCDPGTISEEGHTNALRLYNLYRWLADLPPVVTDPERDRLAQACALLMEANNQLSHDPPMSWECWTEDGAEGAGSSNITTGSSVRSVDGYMIDPGNETTIGHRRWILSNSLGPIGLGSTGDGASCMQNLGGEGRAGKPWMAWPAPGVLPLQATTLGRQATLDETGWTVQSDDIDLGSASITVTSDGTDMPVSVTQLDDYYGSRYALRFNPEGWETEAGRTYAVSVEGISTPISYEVSVVDCSL